MNGRFVLFDLDNTLVDSLHLKPLRDAGRWSSDYGRVSTVTLFDGIAETWHTLKDAGFHIGIVTHSPRTYATKVLEHVGLKPDKLVAYHDLNRKRKPSPFGYELCSEGRAAKTGIAIGDDRADLVAADAFGCKGLFAGWCREPAITRDACETAGWSFMAHPREIIEFAGK